MEGSSLFKFVADFSVSVGVLIFFLVKYDKLFNKLQEKYDSQIIVERKRNSELTKEMMDIFKVATSFDTVNTQIAKNHDLKEASDRNYDRIQGIYESIEKDKQ
jgi:hypothetical protein